MAMVNAVMDRLAAADIRVLRNEYDGRLLSAASSLTTRQLSPAA